jgi:dipeptidyl aminopeptidase/acylaminoacyl peptidase
MLIVDNTGSYPQAVNITSITYTLTEMTITWNQSVDSDFDHYELLVSDSEDGDKTLIATVAELDNTTLVLTDFDPTQPRWYWLGVSDTLGLKIVGTGYYVIDEYPTQVELYPVNYYNGSFILQWSQNGDDDFSTYTIEEISYEDTSNVEIIFSTNEREITEHTIDNIPDNLRKYYKIKVTDDWGLVTSSNLILASSYHKILFTDINRHDLYVMDVDGINERFVHAVDGVGINNLVFTSDGQTIIFVDDGKIYSIEITGFNRTQLTEQYNNIRGLDISPDDSKIVFIANYDIMIMSLDGTGLTQLSNNQYNELPTFTPDGNNILYHMEYDIFRIDINGSNVQQLTDAPNDDKHPEFSPDGMEIVFVSERYSQDGWENYWLEEIFVMEIDGDNQTRLTFSDAQPTGGNKREYPQYSHDGTKILFTSHEGVLLMDNDGSNMLNIYGYSGDQSATFNSDGSKVAFSYLGNIFIYDISSKTSTELGEGKYPMFLP